MSISNKLVTVGTSSLVIANELFENKRKEIFICNSSTGGQVITLAFDSDAVALVGMPLYPGGSFSSSADGNKFFPIEKQIQAISNLAGGTLSIVERIE